MVVTNILNTSRINSLKEPGRYHDGQGLYLVISKSGSKSWLFRYQFQNRRREMGFGNFPIVTLGRARDKRTNARQLMDMGFDPIEARDEAKKEKEQREKEAEKPTFQYCAEQLILKFQPEWKNPKHAAQWASTLETYVYPVFGDKPVDQVNDDDVLQVLQPIWLSKNETASRIRGRIQKVLGWAKSKKYRTGENPALWSGHLEFMLPNPRKVQTPTNFASLPYEHVPQFFKTLIELNTRSSSALAVVILTALRSTEARHGLYSEIENDIWTIPTSRIKTPNRDQHGRPIPHSVPLSCLEHVLMRRFREAENDKIFPSLNEGSFLSETAIRKIIKNHKGDLPHFTIHGFRSSFKTWAVEKSDVMESDMVSEAQLGHKLGDDVKVAYLRTMLLNFRKEMMRAWRLYCLSLISKQALFDLGLSEDDLHDLGYSDQTGSPQEHSCNS